MLEQLQTKNQGAERCTQFVRGNREELVAHSERGLGLLIAFALAQVGHYDADRRTLFQVNRIERELSWKIGSRNGHLSANGLLTSFSDQSFERVALFRGYELPHVAAHDPIEWNAGHACKCGVRAQDGTIARERDGSFVHALD